MVLGEGDKEFLNLSEQYKSIVVVGSQQSGKTTLVRLVFPDSLCKFRKSSHKKFCFRIFKSVFRRIFKGRYTR
ncbi:hypothetical protein Q4Q35_06655 [Flavivirga aquimarina]|uniref:AAA domain-containing protein n=1 Tax=Flavivirga aquimarina TaxID=2027862 RepID=A0ABT8W8R8_9FLAO|nr:hypothetical protein [Flavivirga aquimarina]MDO5969481.1 hypothetical protein [Flavivirga aquimarina]